MSADNPTDTTADKPVPPAPAPAETDGSADVYDPDLDELADEALSRPPIDYDGEPVPAQGGGENQGGVPAASGSAGGQEGAGQGEAGPGVTRAPVVREQGGPQPSESAGPLEQEGKPPGPVTADGGGEVYDPDLDELADEALSRPPIDYDEEPVPAPARSHDLSAARGPGVPESETETSAPRRPGRENGQQDGQPGPRREPAEAETKTEAGDSGNPAADSGEQPGDDNPSADAATQGIAAPDVPEPTAVGGPPVETESVTEAGGGQDTADPTRAVAWTEDVSITPTAGPDVELSGGQEPQPAERPEDPATLAVTPEAAEEPGPVEPDPEAEPEDPLVVIAAEPITSGDRESEENTAALEAEPLRAGTTEHYSQTQDPEPEPETALALAGIGGPGSADAASSPSSETADPATPDAGTGQHGDASSEVGDHSIDAPPWAAALVSAVESLQAKNKELEQKIDAQDARVGEIEARHQAEISNLKEEFEEKRQEDADAIRAESAAELDAAEARHQEETDHLRQRISDLEARMAAAQQTNTEAVDARLLNGELAREEPEAPDRGDLSTAGKDAFGLAGTFGMVHPVLGLAMSLDSARRDFREMAPEDQITTINVAGTVANAYGSMSPGTATAAVIAAVAAPRLHAGFRDLADKFRRKE